MSEISAKELGRLIIEKLGTGYFDTHCADCNLYDTEESCKAICEDGETSSLMEACEIMDKHDRDKNE